ncbi:TlpA disulfide reductase family protein [Singulisphaera sp. Ch08]|uniref:TlpA disulfide reductase family protein n=1 Tax=Singulisphaera sp. Ch08 TaxID=3120278 RepID=A0AAU7CHS0_9BACT
MRKIVLNASAAVLVVLSGLAAAGSVRAADDRPADQILADLKAAELPKFEVSKRDDREAVMKYLDERTKVATRRAELILELYRAHPDNEQLAPLMTERWQTLGSGSRGPLSSRNLSREVDEVLKATKNETLRLNALFEKGSLAIRPRAKEVPPEVEEFIKQAPHDERGARLLYMHANAVEDDAKAHQDLLKRLVADYPESPYGKMAEGTIKQMESVGKPFDLEFTDAINDSPVSIKGLKGKVVVIDFWATWCGPCVAELPEMKKLYEEYRGQGVEFIGVSLDESKEAGGLDKLKEFVAKNEIKWPQYYQGNGWESEFSRGWGIHSIPALFVVDPDGKLHSVNARGKLETMIPALLKKKEPKAEGED